MTIPQPLTLARWNADQAEKWSRYARRYGLRCTPEAVARFAEAYSRKHAAQRIALAA